VLQQPLVYEFSGNRSQSLEQVSGLILGAQLCVKGLEATKELSFGNVVTRSPGQRLVEFENRVGRLRARRFRWEHGHGESSLGAWPELGGRDAATSP
jgi:hypothetical protein